jgi:hypothetical protein
MQLHMHTASACSPAIPATPATFGCPTPPQPGDKPITTSLTFRHAFVDRYQLRWSANTSKVDAHASRRQEVDQRIEEAKKCRELDAPRMSVEQVLARVGEQSAYVQRMFLS